MSVNTEKSATEKYVDDAAITAKIKAKYIADDLIKAFDVHVVTKDYVVTLSGKVKNITVANQAMAIAKNTSGVKDVVSHLEYDDADANTTAKEQKYEYL